MQVESKLMSIESNCQSHEQTLISCESTYIKHLENQIVLEKLKTLITKY